VSIGKNAFASLTSVATVESFIPGTKIVAIPDNAFATAVYKKPLIVPDGSMGKYNTTAGWNRFKTIKNESGKILGNANGDSRTTMADYSIMYELVTVTKPKPVPEELDINGDGRLTLADYSLLYDLITR
jgi:hypothetical protein